MADGYRTPDEDDEYQQQQQQYLLYDSFYGHYSPAGRGYPHGLRTECPCCPGSFPTGPSRLGIQLPVDQRRRGADVAIETSLNGSAGDGTSSCNGYSFPVPVGNGDSSGTLGAGLPGANNGSYAVCHGGQGTSRNRCVVDSRSSASAQPEVPDDVANESTC
jgi:hypothetical protein